MTLFLSPKFDKLDYKQDCQYHAFVHNYKYQTLNHHDLKHNTLNHHALENHAIKQTYKYHTLK